MDVSEILVNHPRDDLVFHLTDNRLVENGIIMSQIHQGFDDSGGVVDVVVERLERHRHGVLVLVQRETWCPAVFVTKRPSVRLVEDDIVGSIAAGDSERLVFQPLGGTLGVSKDRLDVVTNEPLTGATGLGRFHREHIVVFQVGHVDFHTAGLVVVSHKTYLSGSNRVHRHYNPCRT